MTKIISPKHSNITKLTLIESLDLNFPVGLRRFAIGQEVENKIDKEWQIHKLLSKFQTITSLTLFGTSVGVLFPHPWHLQYYCVIAVLATILVVTTMYSRNRHTTISARLKARRSKLYVDHAKTKIWQHIKFIEPALPKALLPLLKIPLIQDKLRYQRQLILQKILVGQFKANMVLCNSLNSILNQKIYVQQK